MPNLFDIDKWKRVDYPPEENPLAAIPTGKQIHFSAVAGESIEPVTGKNKDWPFVNIVPIWKVFGTVVRNEPLEVFAYLKSRQRLRRVQENFQVGHCVDFCGTIRRKARSSRVRVQLHGFRISGDADMVLKSQSEQFVPILFL